MDTYAFNTTSIFYYDGLHELCRICGRASNDLNSLFDDNGSSYDFSSKVNEYLPITVSFFFVFSNGLFKLELPIGMGSQYLCVIALSRLLSSETRLV